MTWLITGGAGYIGAHVVAAFVAQGMDVAVLDDVSSGQREFVPDEVPFVETSLLNQADTVAALVDFDVHGVVHLAGFKYAGVSVTRPLHTYQQNVTGMINLLQAMTERSIDKIVYSSSASVYGTPDTDLVTEDSPVHPESPYGETKLIGEWLLRDVARAETLQDLDFAHTSLRYFNVVGSGSDDLFDASPHNLFPIVLDQLSKGEVPYINGDDYPTPDGTCVRDYVHVVDVALAHVAAARAMDAGIQLAPVYNLGSGEGLSVRQILAAVQRVTEIDFTAEVRPRRSGDPARIVADGTLASRDLQWQMRHDVDDMVRSAWSARQAQ